MNKPISGDLSGSLLDPQPRDLFEQELLSRKAPVLSDGISLSDLVDIRNREVKLRVFDDPELHRMEMDRIWSQVWVPVCHETDLPTVGDYKRGYIGEDRVILTRARDGSINLLLNVCSHRAMEICWSDEGNNPRGFKCPYHGWAFDLKGDLLGAPFEKEEYGNWDKSRYSLRKAKIAQRHGVYFATFNPNPPSLEEYLTEFVGFFDLMFGSHEMVSLNQPRTFSMGIIPANWKANAEQNTGDGYHAVTLHRSLYEQGLIKGGDAKGFSLDCYDTSSTGGHGLRVVETDASVYGKAADTSFPFGWFIAGSMFPSCGIYMNATHAETKDGEKVDVFTAAIGARAPLGVGQASDSGFGTTLMNKEAYELLMSGNLVMPGPSGGAFEFRGAVGNDDPESWMSETRVARGAVARNETIKYNALDGASNPPGFPEGLGLVHRGFSKDDNQWHFWLAYYDWMTRN